MKLGREVGSVFIAGGLLAGCAQGAAPTVNPRRMPAPLYFQKDPTTNFSQSSCYTDPENWAIEIFSSSPQERGTVDTIGVEGQESGDLVNILAGATIQDLGGFTFRISTSMDKPGQSDTVNLSEHDYAQVLDGEQGEFDAVLSGRLGPNGNAYFTVNCLPDFNFNGGQKTVPLVPGPSQIN